VRLFRFCGRNVRYLALRPPTFDFSVISVVMGPEDSLLSSTTVHPFAQLVDFFSTSFKLHILTCLPVVDRICVFRNSDVQYHCTNRREKFTYNQSMAVNSSPFDYHASRPFSRQRIRIHVHGPHAHRYLACVTLSPTRRLPGRGFPWSS
jgi:hypothetical protein